MMLGAWGCVGNADIPQITNRNMFLVFVNYILQILLYILDLKLVHSYRKTSTDFR